MGGAGDGQLHLDLFFLLQQDVYSNLLSDHNPPTHHPPSLNHMPRRRRFHGCDVLKRKGLVPFLSNCEFRKKNMEPETTAATMEVRGFQDYVHTHPMSSKRT